MAKIILNTPFPPETFSKSDFCKAVTGHTNHELDRLVTTSYVDPVAETLGKMGRDEPRTTNDEFAERFSIFMHATFRIPLKDIPPEELYRAFRKHRAFEEYVHPRDQFPLHENYFGPTYRRIEDAHQAGNDAELKMGIQELIDKILHD